VAVSGALGRMGQATCEAVRQDEGLALVAVVDPGFADACVVKLGELHPRAEILTTDRRDFYAYRTLAGKPLRCVFPPV